MKIMFHSIRNQFLHCRRTATSFCSPRFFHISKIRDVSLFIKSSPKPCSASLIPNCSRSFMFSSKLLSADRTLNLKRNIITKRGPKFRTPSKIKDASDRIAKEYTSEGGPLLDWNIWAYATADEYQMQALCQRLKHESDYDVKLISKELPDVFRLIPRSKLDLEADRREIFVFSGAVVFWDVPPQERREFLFGLHHFERRPFDQALIEEECERLVYVLHNYDKNGPPNDTVGESEVISGVRRGTFRKEILYLDAAGKDSHAQLLERYTVSNVMSASVQLSMWESDFENLANALDEVAESMNEGKISLRKKRAIAYAGRLTSLRHNVNLHSDLLDHPDFYWERVGLETLYDQASQILCIRRRVRVFNKKLDDAMALIQTIMQELAVTHSARLEWLIILLIMIEVVFDAYHCYKIGL